MNISAVWWKVEITLSQCS